MRRFSILIRNTCRTTGAFLAAGLLLFAPARAAASPDADRDAELLSRGLEAVAACTDETMNDTEKLTALHDWLCLHCDYGATRRGETAYGAIVEGTANCVGYAEAYAFLASLAGLDGTVTYSEQLDHAWILATLDGVRYFTDCTWDDGKNAKLGMIRHQYWLFDELNAESIGHTGWDSTESVPGGGAELAPWHTAVTRVIFEDRYAYYIDTDFCLQRCDRDTWETELLFRAEGIWPVSESGRQELYTSLLLFGGRLFFNTTDSIICVRMDGSDPCTVLSLPEEEHRMMYGTAVQDGIFCFSLAESPDDLLWEICPIAPVRSVWGE